ncbi:hypothetical protein BHYA_0008g00350 [Botrytis hyacinthi]|uniref:Uncharacterized protein n=1 Tax=Botrytis hyacinthi TaxID=278943 RepID=A0A4Z1H0S4_9HELO|nr:hypothetical protein BHYA_0008g00350 [Botrytis hyacinthi]
MINTCLEASLMFGLAQHLRKSHTPDLVKGLKKNKMVKWKTACKARLLTFSDNSSIVHHYRSIVATIGITGSIFFQATYPSRLIALSVEWENARIDRMLSRHVLICMQIQLH